MRLIRARLQNFRNISLATLEFGRGRQFLCGQNGQGKTNLIEAVGLLTALRSFRTADTRHLIQQGHEGATLVFELEHEREGEVRVCVVLGREGKEVSVDQEKVTRFADFIGRYPAVVFSSADIQLLRGGPGGRRRWLDLTLSSADRGYLAALQSYHKALAERNVLLRKGAARNELEAFERTMAPSAVELVSRRKEGLAALGAQLTPAYARIADGSEEVALHYACDFDADSAGAFLEVIKQSLDRDLRFRTTLRGPHRDDFDFVLNGMPAKDYGSEGQQRLLVIALRLAQAAWFEANGRIKPILLADDIVGELDPGRRERFWAAIDAESQVLATGTEVPPGFGPEWTVFNVAAGVFFAREDQPEIR